MELDITNTSLNVEVVVTGENPLSLDVTVPQGADGIVFTLDKPTMGIAALSDGSSPVLTDAAISASIMRGINNDTANWTIGATPVGCTGSLVDHTTYVTFTVATMTSDTATVTFAATRSGFSSLSKVATLTKLKQPTIAAGIEAGTATATPADTDVVPGVDTAHGLKKYTWENIKAALYLKLYDWLIALTAKTTLADGDSFWIADAVGAASKKIAASLLMRRVKMPDGATAVYSQDAWATADGWSATDGTVNYTDYAGYLTIVSTGVVNARATKDFTSYVGKTVLLRVEKVSGTPGNLAIAWAGTYYTYPWGNASSMVVRFQMPLNVTSGTFAIIPNYNVTDAAGVKYKVDWIWIGDYSYLTGSLSEEAARIADQLGDTAGVGVAAQGWLNIAAGNASPGDYFDVGGKRYTFRADVASLTTEGDVLLGSNQVSSSTNMALAIRRDTPALYDKSVSGSDPKYFCAITNALCHAYGNTPTNGIVQLTHTSVPGSLVPKTGEIGNQIVIAKSGTNLAVTGATIATTSTTLTGGYSDAAAKIITGVKAAESIILASTSAYGLAKLAADGGTTAGTAVQANDSRIPSAPISWTPVVNFGGAADDGTFTTAGNRYVTAGKKVHIEFQRKWSAKGTKTGAITITGLPVAAPGTTMLVGMAFIPVNGSSISGPVFVTISGSTLYLVIQSTTGHTELTAANFTNTTEIRVVADYIAA